jgi:microcystin-dependent protein
MKRQFASAALVSALILISVGFASAQEPYIGEVRLFGFNFCPTGWYLANGQLLPIKQNQALFSPLGNYYGGDGQTTSALPNLIGRAPVGWGPPPAG